MNRAVTALDTPSSLGLIVNLFRAMRPKQWVKNGFVFPALIFSHQLTNLAMVGLTLQVFVLFCLLSGSVYLINDIVDREKDRLHPKKCRRPIAAGLLPVRHAAIAAVLIATGSIAWAFNIGLAAGVISLLYFVQTLLYSFYLKRIVLVDVFVLALGFVLRVMVGGAAIHVTLSPWLLITTILLALFLALAKRRHEVTLLENPAAHRGILAEYPVELLDQLITMVTACTVVVYSLYTFLSFPNGNLIYTVPFVLFGVFRYLYLIHRRQGGGEPEAMVVRDLPLLIDVLLWLVTTLVILYVLH